MTPSVIVAGLNRHGPGARPLPNDRYRAPECILTWPRMRRVAQPKPPNGMHGQAFDRCSIVLRFSVLGRAHPGNPGLEIVPGSPRRLAEIDPGDAAASVLSARRRPDRRPGREPSCGASRRSRARHCRGPSLTDLLAPIGAATAGGCCRGRSRAGKWSIRHADAAAMGRANNAKYPGACQTACR